MSNICTMLQEIEDLRQALNRAVQKKNGNLADAEVASLSVQLDRLIVAYEREKLTLEKAGGDSL